MPSKQHTAGAFDIRNVIGGLVGLYGIILTVMGIFGAGDNGTGDASANLWAGLAMLVVGVIFLAWARLRPVKVPAHHESADGQNAG
ncbi:hypothetical protein [Nocardioides mangrovi]|uniref:LPXTG cell wall anchor domain-containing protein n=1 Tax=Nocardioides mangrovi TaxID=2874580 RepID=A0ABS7UAM8_9ACTN|nr:hypothetical protein [Nocardioides mangrovi]MBZ5737867.1 hypothetical protein [Nocardioides mangrovi]